MKLFIGALMACTIMCAVAQAQTDAGFPAPSGDASILIPGEKVMRLFSTGCGVTEGAAPAPDGSVYLSELTYGKSCKDPTGHYFQAGSIWRYDPKTGQGAVYRSPSGQTNEIKFDAAGNMITAEMADFGGQRVTITDMKTGKGYVMAGLYNGRPFMAPNDISIDEKGRIYFTDSRYLGHEPVEQPSPAVYRMDTDGSVHRIAANVGTANGVVVSPDQKRLYVGTFANGTMEFMVAEAEKDQTALPTYEAGQGLNRIWVFDLREDGTLANRRVFVDLPDGGPDGINIDAGGNVYAAVRNPADPAFHVYSPDGKLLAKIPVKEPVGLPTNVGWGRGEDSSILYLTSGQSLYRLKVKAIGYHLPEIKQ